MAEGGIVWKTRRDAECEREKPDAGSPPCGMQTHDPLEMAEDDGVEDAGRGIVGAKVLRDGEKAGLRETQIGNSIRSMIDKQKRVFPAEKRCGNPQTPWREG